MKIAINLTLVLISTFILIVILESAYRLVITIRRIMTGNYNYEICRPRILYLDPPSPYHPYLDEVDDPRGLGFVLKPNNKTFVLEKEVSVNSKGLRDREYTLDKPSNTYRIAVIGDSVTFGLGVNAEESYPKILEGKLAHLFSGNQSIEVLNFGVPGYTASQELIVFKEKVLGYDPDLLIIGYHINDIHKMLLPPLSSSTLSFLRGRSYLFSCIWNGIIETGMRNVRAVNDLSYNTLYREDSITWSKHKSIYQKLATIVHEKNIPALIVLFPRWKDLNNYELKMIYDFLDKNVKDMGFYSLNMVTELENLNLNELEYRINASDVDHPNINGHRLIADAIYKKLLAENILPIKNGR